MRDGWMTCELGQAVTLQRGHDLPGRLRRKGPVPVVSSAGVTDWHAVAAASGPGVVTGRYGTIGEVFYLDGPYWPLNTTLYVRDFHGNSPKFVSYLLRTVDFASHSGKSGVPGINRNDIHKLIVAIPPLEEQEAIAEALSDADAAIEALDALIAKKRDVKQAAMQQLLAGLTRLPGFEGEWEEELVGSLFTFQRTTALSRAQLSEAGEVGYIHYGDIHSRWDTHLDLSRHLLPRVASSLARSAATVVDGDLVLADASEDLDGVGKAVEVMGLGSRQVIAGLHTVLLRPRNGAFAPGFVGYMPSMPAFRVQARTLAAGLKVYGLSKTSLRQIAIGMPSVHEQAAIAQVLMDMDAEVEALVAERDKMRLVKQGMMQELLSGRVRLV
jgi:type I restriction enzyme S subunit